MTAHLAALGLYLGLVFTNLLLPWAIWRWKRNTAPDIAAHALAALNFQISVTVAGLASILMALFIPLAWVLVIAVFTVNIIYVGRAADRAREGQSANYPVLRRWVR